MQLQKIIRTLDNKTLEKAELFFASPYFIAHNKHQITFKIVAENAHLDDAQLKALIWEAIYQNDPYDDSVMRKLLHEVQEKLIEFFSVEQALKAEYSSLRHLNKFVNEHNLHFLKNKLQRKVDKVQFKNSIVDAEAYYDLYTAQRHAIWLEDDFSRKRKYDDEGEFLNDLQRLNSLLDTAYAIEKIRLLLHQNNFNLLTGKNINSIDSESISTLLDPKALEESLLSKTYQDKYNMLISGIKEIDISSMIEKIGDVCKGNIEEGIELFDNLSNFITHQLNQGQDRFQEQFELFKFGLESKILLKSNLLDPTDFRNIVIVACRILEYDWALEFVEEYRNKLSPDYRHSAYSFNKARIFMNMRRYEDAVDMLRDVEYEDITYNINSKLMLMHAFYELDEYDVLESTIRAFKVFLRRRRNISRSRKTNFTDHCDALYNIIKAEERKDTKRLIKAQEIIQSNPGIPNTSWLKSRIKEVGEVLHFVQEPDSP